MLSQFVIFVSGFALATSAFALTETNCSNADGTLMRSEKEIWGANLVDWKLNGNLIESDEIQVDEGSKMILESQRVFSGFGGRKQISTFAMKVMLASGKTDFVICSSWQDEAID